MRGMLWDECEGRKECSGELVGEESNRPDRPQFINANGERSHSTGSHPSHIDEASRTVTGQEPHRLTQVASRIGPARREVRVAVFQKGTCRSPEVNENINFLFPLYPAPRRIAVACAVFPSLITAQVLRIALGPKIL